MITALLAAVVLWCMLIGKVPTITLVLICTGVWLILAISGRHKHTHFLHIDILAQISPLGGVNPGLKSFAAIVLMIMCVAAQDTRAGLFLTAAMAILALWPGRIKPRQYAELIALPLSFLLLSGLALLFEVSRQPMGIINIPVLDFWLYVDVNTQERAALVMSRAFGAVSCLYLLSITTPMPELTGVLRRAHCPETIIGLMYLIYRYIFILLSMYHQMLDAAHSRMGNANYTTSLRTMGLIGSSLLTRSYIQAGRNFDAMESRCFETEIRFLEKEKKVAAAHVFIAAGLIVITLFLLYSSFNF